MIKIPLNFNNLKNINLRNIKWNINKTIILFGIIAFILVIVFWFWWRGDRQLDIYNGTNGDDGINIPKSSISGISCDNYNRRPIAVMLSADAITRPLSSISEADIVFEMPVTPGGVTRMMAVYQCLTPTEIGSIRSAREDFIPLAAGLDAIYAHWGGEREALQELNNHVLDNIDALKYDGIYFYRKAGIKQPHDGFSDLDTLFKAVRNLNYREDDNFIGYLHGKSLSPSNILNLVNEISIDYPSPFDIRWVYDDKREVYKRFRGGKPEIDKNNSSQVEVSVVIVIKTTSRYTNEYYLTVDTTGEGEAEIYQNGIKIPGKWEKDTSNIGSKLFLYDLDGEEIKLNVGKIWVEIVTN